MDTPGRSKGSDAVGNDGSGGSTPPARHQDREADLIVADDAELEGRLDIARELRARHLSAVDLLADDYRVRLGLLPWRVHKAKAQQQHRAWHDLRYGPSVRFDASRRIGRTTAGLLHAIARCEVEGVFRLMIVGGKTMRDHCTDLAGNMRDRLGFESLVIKAVSDRSPHLLFGAGPHVAYRDHVDDEMRALARSPRERVRSPFARFEWREPPSDADPREACPVCGRAPVLRAIESGREACSSPECAAAHGFRPVVVDRLHNRAGFEVADIDGVFRGRMAAPMRNTSRSSSLLG